MRVNSDAVVLFGIIGLLMLCALQVVAEVSLGKKANVQCLERGYTKALIGKSSDGAYYCYRRVNGTDETLKIYVE